MISLAVIGLGQVTRNIHLPAYAQLAGRLQVIGGCDPDAGARTAMQEKEQIPQVFENPEEMVASLKPDIVAICTPPALHRDQTFMALSHGCHVFCEKPVAETLEQTDAMVAAGAAAQRYVVINNQFPYMNIHTAARELIGSPQFGRLLFLHAWQTFRPTEATEAGWRGEMRRRLGFEFGVHVFDLIRFFFGEEPVKLMAHMPNPLGEQKSDVINIVSIEFADGRAASVVLDRLSKGPEHYLEMRLDGEFAAIQTSIGGEVRLEAGMHTREKRPFVGFNLVKGGKAVLQDGSRSKVIAKDGLNPFASATAVHLGNLINAIQTGATPAGTAADNRNTLAMALAAYDSADQGRAVEMAPYLKRRTEGAA